MRKFQVFFIACAFFASLISAPEAFAQAEFEMPPPPSVPQNNFQNRVAPDDHRSFDESVQETMRDTFKKRREKRRENTENDDNFNYMPGSGGCSGEITTQ